MSRTITAMFDTRADAEAAKNRLQQASIDVSHVDLTDQSSDNYAGASNYGSGTTETTGSTTQPHGFWASLKSAFTPSDDHHVYEEGIRRGATLLTATVDDDEADRAVEILDNANSIDIDGRANDWRQSGWNAQPAATGAAAGMAGGAMAGTTGNRAYGTEGREEVIPVVEEQLRVGKREVNRGGVRVRSYVVETPVNEQVTLHEENVSVERRPVSGAGTVPADAFRERTIEMTETAEEAVVAKDARVVEEVVVQKTGSDRTETISDTVRRTEVEVDDAGNERFTGLQGDTNASGYGTSGTGTTGYGTSGTTGTTGGVGLGDKIAGAAKEATGKVTGNDDLARRGETQQGKTGY